MLHRTFGRLGFLLWFYFLMLLYYNELCEDVGLCAMEIDVKRL